MRKTILFFSGSILIIAILSLVFVVTSVIYGKSIDHIKPPSLLGNSKENIERVNENDTHPRPFSFWVAGDTRTATIFEAFYENPDYPIETDFSVILGDFARDAEIEYHNFFISEFTEWGLKKPVFLLAGNHDIAVQERFEKKVNAFFAEDFENTYGQRSFYFKHAGCLFVVIDNLHNDEYLDYLRDVLSTESKGTEMTFVLMHISPPSIIPMETGATLEGEKEFFEIIDEFNVDYVISANFHSYLRYDRGGTRYIISGGGGGHLKGGVYGFHHAIVFIVDPENKKVTELLFPFERPFDFADDIEKTMVAKVYPIFKYYLMLGLAILIANLIAIILLGWGFVATLRKN